ncbi:hypothetical protein [Niveibacterium terrae]|uniref:hypothetical protein n=1 Tax=Niveibacterium terrae TaxID=3373598 RepID=UPI003A90E3C1
MQIVVTAFLDEAEALVRASLALVDRYQSRDPDFLAALIGWLKQGEALLEKYRRPQLAAFAALRARALAAQAGVNSQEGRRLAQRKQSAGAGALILGEAQALLADVQTKLVAQRDEASRLILQMLQILIQNGSLTPLLAAPAAERIAPIWQCCLARPEVATGARQVLGLVAWPDALRLVDETLAAWRL